jgi:dihydroxyacetone kinase-like protein
MTVVQATGDHGELCLYAGTDRASAVAQSISARCVNITAPAIVASAQIATHAAGRTTDRRNSSPRWRGPTASFRHLVAPAEFDHPHQRLLRIRLPAAISGEGRRRCGSRAFHRRAGKPVTGPLDDRIIGISLEMLTRHRYAHRGRRRVRQGACVACGAPWRYVNVLITDAATGGGILRADGVTSLDSRLSQRPKPDNRLRPAAIAPTSRSSSTIPTMLWRKCSTASSRPMPSICSQSTDRTARWSPATGRAPGKVGLVIGGGTGHEPGFIGYVGKGLADAVAVGNIFSSPPPDPILQCAKRHLAARRAVRLRQLCRRRDEFRNGRRDGRGTGHPEVRTVLTTDDIASSPLEDKEGRRGVAGNFFIFKVAGAACDRGLTLDECEAITRKANARTFTVGVALEPCSHAADPPAQFRDRPGGHGSRHGHPRRARRDRASA